ncbi:hypothetical protein SLNSH_02955 [Alsobacter soli]|uniref:Uncharacterized protein n=1 Tax=Alsobacter soli TaxID=2109933 RepID=A0A2T1HYU6_9HYPH|nr:hypothetical protein SLNSH_02955 [Alsobacter soli]
MVTSPAWAGAGAAGAPGAWLCWAGAAGAAGVGAAGAAGAGVAGAGAAAGGGDGWLWAGCGAGAVWARAKEAAAAMASAPAVPANRVFRVFLAAMCSFRRLALARPGARIMMDLKPKDRPARARRSRLHASARLAGLAFRPGVAICRAVVTRRAEARPRQLQ